MIRTELAVEAIAVAAEDAPRYLAVEPYSGDPEDLLALLAASTEQVPQDLRELVGGLGLREAAVMIDFVSSLVRAAGIPISTAQILQMREDGAELAGCVLNSVGPPPHPQPLALVQSSSDRDTSAMLLAKLVHERNWHDTEELGITHLGELGATGILDLLSWLVDPHVGATVIVTDQPYLVRDSEIPQRLTAVALRFGRDGVLDVLDWGEGRPPAGADRQFGGRGACGGWPDLHAAIGRRQLAAGEHIVVRSGAGDLGGWGLLRCTGEVGDRPAWWRAPIRLGRAGDPDRDHSDGGRALR